MQLSISLLVQFILLKKKIIWRHHVPTFLNQNMTTEKQYNQMPYIIFKLTHSCYKYAVKLVKLYSILNSGTFEFYEIAIGKQNDYNMFIVTITLWNIILLYVLTSNVPHESWKYFNYFSISKIYFCKFSIWICFIGDILQ